MAARLPGAGGRPHLVATLGPASFGRAAELVAAGADALRLNASHLRPAALAGQVSAARRAAPGVPIVVDVQGAKVRLGWFAPRTLSPGERVALAPVAEIDAEIDAGIDADGLAVLPLPHPEVFAALAPGEALCADDARLRFTVVAAGPDRVVLECLAGGVLAPRKGLNRARHPVALRGLSDGDRAHLAVAGLGPGDAVACSFLADGSEAAWFRAAAPGVPVVGKVERAAALDAIDAIGAAVDAVWICRGDLGAQVGLARMAAWVGRWSPRSLPVPVWMAGQVLEHLTTHPEPTRSEVCHVHDLLARGYAGVVLSDETAVGRDPLGAVRQARALLDA
jgi:pyruvate kinase